MPGTDSLIMPAYPHPDTKESLTQQAAEWLVLQTVDDPQARQYYREAFARWQAAQPEHAAAAHSMQGMLQQLQTVQNVPKAGSALRSALGRKRRMNWAALSALPLLLWVLWQPAWRADYHNAHDQQQQLTLSDGSRLTLRGSAELDIQFDANERRIRQFGGELRVDVGKDNKRPFVIQTRHGEIQALGTRFIVRDSAAGTGLLMLESRVQLRQHGNNQAVASAGQHWWLGPKGVRQQGRLDWQEQETAWQQNLLVVHDVPLPQVLAVLQSHLPGWSHMDEAALADIRVSAVLPLQQPEQALRLLESTLPALQITRLGPLRYMSRRG